MMFIVQVLMNLSKMEWEKELIVLLLQVFELCYLVQDYQSSFGHTRFNMLFVSIIYYPIVVRKNPLSNGAQTEE